MPGHLWGMSDSQHYTHQAQAFSLRAATAVNPEERTGYLSLAASYAQLAAEAAKFEAKWGHSLTQAEPA